MVSETKKPLVISINFLLIFISVLASVGIYMLVEILNQNKSITPSATNVLGKTKNGNNSSKSLSDLVTTQNTVTNAKNKFKKKHGGAEETGAEETEETEEFRKTIEAFDDLDRGKVHDYAKLLKDFEVEIISSQIPDENEIDINESKAKMRFNKISKDVDSTVSICETYQVANTFDIRGSKGYIVFFNNQRPDSSNISVESMLELKDGMEIIFEKDLTVKEQEQQTEIICHVQIIAAKTITLETVASATVAEVETPNPNPIDNELIRALVNSLLTGDSLKPEALLKLHFLEVFTILVGIAPEQSLNFPFIEKTVNRYLYKSQALIVSDVFCLPGIEGLSIIKAQDGSSSPPNIPKIKPLQSSEEYKNYLTSDFDLKHFFTSRLKLKNDLNFTVYFGTNMNDDGLHAFISNNLIEICQAMIDGAWISKFHSFWYSEKEDQKNYLSQLKESSYAFLFLFDGDEYFDSDSIKCFNEDLVQEEKDLISSKEIDLYGTVAQSFQLKNLAGDSRRQGYQFVLKEKDYSPVYEKKFINEFTLSGYQFIVKGLNLEGSKYVAGLITEFIDYHSSDEQSLAQEWIEFCKNTEGSLYNQNYYISTDILLWKIF